jgi:hypothetical protein
VKSALRDTGNGFEGCTTNLRKLEWGLSLWMRLKEVLFIF